jgi:uridine kinase
MTDARTTIYERIGGQIQRRKAPGRAFIVGVTGADCSGKSVFAAGLDGFLRGRGVATQLVNLDDFHQPAAVRHAGADRDEDHWRRVKAGKVFNFERLADEVLRPSREGKPFTARFTAGDWRSDDAAARTLTITPDTIVILEGVFLLLEDVRPFLDYVIFLDAGEVECLRRARERDAETAWRRYETRYLPAARSHRAAYPPEKHADIIVDNNDWTAPRLR